MTYLEFGAGALIAVFALADVFSTLFVPGPTAGPASVVLNLRRAVSPLWLHYARRREQRACAGNRFAPMILVMSFLAWLLLLLFGFAMMLHANADQFAPRLGSFGDAVYVAGSSLLTLGVGETDVHGVARWLILLAGLAGFSLVTAAIGFSAQVQRGVHQRETGVLSLAGLAGSPPSGIALLESFATLEMTDTLSGFFLQWRDWSAATLESHTARPVLSYFGSVDAEIDWIAALEAVLDAATILNAFTDHRASGAAALMHRTGSLTAIHLQRMFHLPTGDTDEMTGADAVVDRLTAAGFTVPDPTGGARRFARMASDYRGALASLSGHLGTLRAGSSCDAAENA